MAEQSLDDLLVNGAARGDKGRFASPTPGEPEPVAPKEPPSEPVVVKPDPTPPVAPVAVAPVAPVVPVESEKERAYQSGMLEERKKRQAAEARIRELEAPPKPAVDPWSDLPGALAQQQQTFQDQLREQRLLVSEDIAREKYKDFEEVIAHFSEAVKSNPSLADQMVTARNPAEYAYKQGLLHRELGSVNGDPIAYRTKLETDIRAKVEAEYAKKYGLKPVPVVPTSLNSDTSPAVTTEVYAGPPPLASILRNASRS